MAGFQCASCLQTPATCLVARFKPTPDIGIFRVELMEHNMVTDRA